MAGRHTARHAISHRGEGAGGVTSRSERLTWWRQARGLLASARGLSVLMAVVTLVTTLFLLLTPILQQTAYDHALGDALDGQPTAKRDINLRYPTDRNPGSEPGLPPGRGPDAPFAAVDGFVRTALGPDVLPLIGEATHASTTPSLLVARREAKPLTKELQQVVVRMQSDVAGKVQWTQGSAPGPASDTFTVDQGLPDGATHVVPIVPVALRDTTAATMEVGVGDVLELTGVNSSVTPMVVRIVGLYAPLDKRDPLWESDARMLGIARVPDDQGGVATEAAMLADPANYGAVSDSLLRFPPLRGEMWRSVVLNDTWRYPLAADRLRERDLATLRDALFRLQSDARTWQGLPEAPTVSTGLVPLLADYERSLTTTGAMTSFAYAGIAALAALTLTVTALAGLGRRWGALTLMRARGASVSQVIPLIAAATSMLALGAVVIAGLGLWGFGRSGAPAWVAVLGILALPLVVVLVVVIAALRPPTVGASAASTRARRLRRAVAELAILGLAILAVTTVRSRAADLVTGRGGQIDWYAALTPFLVALAAAVVTIRVVPMVVGLLSRLAAHRRSAVGFLGFARAARTRSSGAIPLAAIVVGTSLISLLGSIAVDISQHRVVSSYQVVGAEARVDAEVVDDALVTAIEHVSGVSEVAVAHVAPSSSLVLANGDQVTVQVVAVDWPTYAKVLANTPIALSAVSGSSLAAGAPSTGGDPKTPMPVLLSRPLTQVKALSVRGTAVPVREVAVAPALARIFVGREATVVLVPRTGSQGLESRVPLTLPNTVFVRTSEPDALAGVDESSLGALVTGVHTASGQQDRVAGSALPTFVLGTQAVGMALSALLVLLAIALLVMAGRQDRLQLLLRLRTMGLRQRVQGRLAWAELLPQALLATGVGAAIGLFAVTLIAPAIDLAPYTGGAPHPPVVGHWVVALATGLAVSVLTVMALVVEHRRARGMSVSENLRRGDNP